MKKLILISALFLTSWVLITLPISSYAEEVGKKFTVMAEEWAGRKSIEILEPVDRSLMYMILEDNFPVLNQINVVYMGDQIIKQRSGFYLDCLVPKFQEVSKKPGGWILSIRRNIPICNFDIGNKDTFKPLYFNGIQVNGGKWVYKVKLEEKKGEFKICLKLGRMNGHCKKGLTEKDFDMAVGFVAIDGLTQRTIEYVGKRGNILKFIYSEFADDSDNYIRDSFTREFEIDLEEGNVVAYKGSVFEIIDATNATIKYKVVRVFGEEIT